MSSDNTLARNAARSKTQTSLLKAYSDLSKHSHPETVSGPAVNEEHDKRHASKQESIQTDPTKSSTSPDQTKPDPLSQRKSTPNALLPKSYDIYIQRHEDLKDFRSVDIRRSWFSMAHMLLTPGSVVLDAGCRDGRLTYIMAVLNPDIHFVGVDANKSRISQAKKTYKRDNLEFKCVDLSKAAPFKEESFDGVINSFILYEVYTRGQFQDEPLMTFVKTQLKLLKPEGTMFIRDYPVPPPEEYVCIEMPDFPSKGQAIEDLSEPDLLIRFSDEANSNNKSGCRGFFLEELPARFPKTRLFRLPYKWAYEFILRKDRRERWSETLEKQFTYFTQREFRKNLRGLGGRVLYTAPHWNEKMIQERFAGSFRLYDDNGNVLGTPPTSFISVVQKVKDGESIRVHEMRPAKEKSNKLKVTAMRNDLTGKTYDIVSREAEITQVLPYRITEDGTLNVYIHESLPRGIVNAVPRNGTEIDRKRWSGHMVEAVSLPAQIVRPLDKATYKDLVLFSRDYLGLKPALNAALQKGPSVFPAPDFIDEAIHTRFLRVSDNGRNFIPPKAVDENIAGFTSSGQVREVSAQRLLDAISVGYIPNSFLETQIERLFEILDLPYESWAETPLAIEEAEEGEEGDMLDGKAILDMIRNPKKQYKQLKSPTGDVRTVESIFVDEGWVKGGIQGQDSQNIEFAFSDEETLNKAVVVPLTKRANSDEVLAGFHTEFLPVPERYQGCGVSINAPSFNLPKDVKTMDEAKEFVAKKFGVRPDQVARFGESYFSHIGITPLRIFPFVVTSSKRLETPEGGPVQLAPLRYIGWLFGCLDKDDFCFSNATFDIFKKLRRNQAFNSEHARQFSSIRKNNYDFGYRATIVHGSICPPNPSLDNMPDISRYQETNPQPLTNPLDVNGETGQTLDTSDTGETSSVSSENVETSKVSTTEEKTPDLESKINKMETDLRALKKHALDKSFKCE